MPKPVPTLSTSPSGATPGSSETARRQPSSVVTSATTTAALPPSSVMTRQVSSAAASSRSTQTTDAPSRAARTAMARPLPTGASGSREGWVPAPITVMQRPSRSVVIGSPAVRAPYSAGPPGTLCASASARGSSGRRNERSTVVNMR